MHTMFQNMVSTRRRRIRAVRDSCAPRSPRSFTYIHSASLEFTNIVPMIGRLMSDVSEVRFRIMRTTITPSFGAVEEERGGIRHARQRADRTCGNQEQRAFCRARIDFPFLERWKSILWVA